MTQAVVLFPLPQFEYRAYAVGDVVDFSADDLTFLKQRRLVDDTPAVVAAAIASGKVPVTHVAGLAPEQSGSGVQYPRQATFPSGLAWLNTGITARTVSVSGGTVTAVYLATASAPTNYVQQGSTSGNFTVVAGGQIKLDWSAQPTVTIS